MDVKEINSYLISDKSNWYTTDNKGKKTWDKDLISKFWEIVRFYKIKKNDNDFSHCIFPPFETISEEQERNNTPNNFWTNSSRRLSGRPFKFHKAKFLDIADFSRASLNSVFTFRDTIFCEDANFSHSSFGSFFRFENVIFLGKAQFSYAKIDGSLHFVETRFMKDIHFGGCTVNESLDFTFVKSFGHTNTFDRIKVNGELKFFEVEFKSNVNFIKIDVEEGELKFIGIKNNDKGIYNFNDSSLGRNVVFRRCELKNFLFSYCNIVETSFLDCKWNINKRIILRDENNLDNEKRTLESTESLYRQLKKNYDSNKDWELSGYAYVSEMEMRKKRLKNERDFYTWLIFCIYDIFGGYTQDFKKPLVWLIRLIAVCSVAYYFIDYNVLKALQRGVKGAIPYIIIDTDDPFKGWWLLLRNFEFLMASILLTFFVLALRKRFKQ